MKQKYFLRCKLWLAGVFFLWTVSAAQAQNASCPNLDFSFRNFQNWICQTANSANTYTAFSALNWAGDTAIKNRHTIITKFFEKDMKTACTGMLTDALSLVPDGYSQCARIGDDSANMSADCIRYTFTVDSNNAQLLIHFAEVLCLVGHDTNQIPRFEVRIQDARGNLLPKIPGYLYSSPASSEDSSYRHCPGRICWRDWTSFGVDLRSMIGKDVQVVFFASDCTQGNCLGYGYGFAEIFPADIDVQCCEGSSVARLVAPEGYVSYTWRDSKGQIVCLNERFNVPHPTDGMAYTCEAKSVTGFTAIYKAVIHQTRLTLDLAVDMDTCCHKIYLAQKVKVIGSEVSNWTWEIGKKGVGTEFYSNDSVLDYQFKDTGLYEVRLTVNAKNGCSKDTLFTLYNSQIVNYMIPEVYCVFDTCAQQLSLSVDAETMDPDISSWSWTIGKNGVTEYSGNDTAVKYVFKDTGVYEIRLTVQMKNGCVLDTVFSVSNRYVTPEIPAFDCVIDICVQKLSLSLDAKTIDPDISSWSWTIEKKNGAVEYSSSDMTVQHVFKDTGLYEIRLTVQTRNGCPIDTVFSVRNVASNIPAFNSVFDTCAQQLSLSLDAKTIDPNINHWLWTIEKKSGAVEYSGSDTVVEHVFKDTDLYEVRLAVRTRNGCRLDTAFSVSNRYVAPEITVASITPEYCRRADGTIRMEVKGDTPHLHYSWLPEEVDAAVLELKNLKAGTYTFRVSDGPCTVSKDIVVDSVPGPQADFTLSADSVAENERLILSESAVSNGAPLTAWVWNFGDGTSDTGRVVTHSYSREGNYAISLTVLDNNRCFGSADKRMRVFHVLGVSVEDYDEEGTYRMYIPNAFTPNGDGLNDGWGPSLQEYLDEDYFLSVYDSQGRLVWHSSNPSARWDGTVSGRPVRGGSVYAYRLRVRDYTGKLHEYAGHVTVVK